MSIVFPPDFVINSTLKIGVVYKFEASELIETEIPHYFIIIAIDGDDNFLAMCTTQLESQSAYIRRKGYDAGTLTYIQPNKENGLKEDSYVNCNNYFNLTKAQLIEKVTSKKFELTGNLSDVEYAKIVNSITLSTVNDIPHFLLEYPK